MSLLLFFAKLGWAAFASPKTTGLLQMSPLLYTIMAFPMGIFVSQLPAQYHLVLLAAIYIAISMEGTGILMKEGDREFVRTLPVRLHQLIEARWLLCIIATAPLTLPLLMGMAVGGGQRETLGLALALAVFMTATASSLSLIWWRFPIMLRVLPLLLAVLFLVDQVGLHFPRWYEDFQSAWWDGTIARPSLAVWVGNFSLLVIALGIAWVLSFRKEQVKSDAAAHFHISRWMPPEWDLLRATARSNGSIFYFLSMLFIPLVVYFVVWNGLRMASLPITFLNLLTFPISATAVLLSLGLTTMKVIGYQKDGAWLHQLPVVKSRVVLFGALQIGIWGWGAGVFGAALWVILWRQGALWIAALASSFVTVVGTTPWLEAIAMRFSRIENVGFLDDPSMLFLGLLVILWNVLVLAVEAIAGPEHVTLICLTLGFIAVLFAFLGFRSTLHQYERWQ